jgi:diguanylate cyclase (GGDEF)-like protein
VDGDPVLRRIAQSESAVVLTDTCSEPGWSMEWIRSYAAAPIIVKGRLVGFINLVGLRPGFFTAEHASRLRAFADQVAMAIENARLYAEVERLATLDEVTGVANRRRLFELGQREFERARRYDTPLSAILLDLDHFKQINDTYGHHAGDRVLAGIAAAIQASVRQIDLFGRYGGEEFVLLLPDSPLPAAVEVAERLRALVENLRFDTARGELRVTVSLGVAQLAHGIPALPTLIDRADQAMYAAKQAGRNRVEQYR